MGNAPDRCELQYRNLICAMVMVGCVKQSLLRGDQHISTCLGYLLVIISFDHCLFYVFFLSNTQRIMKSKGVGIETPYSHAHKHILLHQMVYLSLTCQTWPKTTREELMHWLALEQGDWKFPELWPNSTGETHLLPKPEPYLGSVDSHLWWFQMDQAPRMMMELRPFFSLVINTIICACPPCIKGVVVRLGGEVL
jgi:hypothetical protein